MKIPHVFISYSWTSEEYIRQVLDLATRLMHDGVRVTIDKWHLQEGHDKYSFMERMVTDEDIEKVLVLCDHGYAKKADSRKGGVGEESQIISPEVYKKVDQEKFLPVIMERTEAGEPCAPKFLAARIYFDLSEPQREGEEYERLVRFLYGKPLHRPPTLGAPPSYVTEDAPVAAATGSKARSFRDAVHNARPNARGLFRDYLDALVGAVENERLEAEEANGNPEVDDLVVASIERMQPHRAEYADMIRMACRYRPYDGWVGDLHAFMEKLLQVIRHRPSGIWNEAWADNLSFFGRELFLVTAVIMLDEQEYDGLAELLGRHYFIENDRYDQIVPCGFGAFDEQLQTLDTMRNSRLRLGRLSVTADLIRGRIEAAGQRLEMFLETEMVLYVRSVLDLSDASESDQFIGYYWRPRTVVFRSARLRVKLFQRLRSRAFFDSFAPVLGVPSKEALVERLARIPSEGFAPVSLGFDRLTGRSIPSLLGIKSVASSP